MQSVDFCWVSRKRRPNWLKTWGGDFLEPHEFFSLLFPLHWILGILFRATWRAYFFFQKILPCTNTFLKCTSPAPPPSNNVSNGPSHLSLLFVFLFSCHDSHDSVKGATVVGKVQKRNRYRASFYNRHSQDDHRAGLWTVRRSRIFSPFDRAYFITKQGLTEL